MSDNSEPNPTQTEVTSSEQLVGLVPIEGEDHNIGVQLISGDTDEDFFGTQAIELNGERHVIVSQAQDPETGELLLVLRGENGEHIAIQSEALSSMVQASGGDNIQVSVETQEEGALTLASDIISLSQSVSTTETNPMTTSLTALPSIIANIPSQTQQITAPTNVVQSIDTPRVSQEEQPSVVSSIPTVTSALTPLPLIESDQTPEPTTIPLLSIEKTENQEIDVNKEEEEVSKELIDNTLPKEENERKTIEIIPQKEEESKEKIAVIADKDTNISERVSKVEELKETVEPKEDEVSIKIDETEDKITEPKITIESIPQILESNEIPSDIKNEELEKTIDSNVILESTPVPEVTTTDITLTVSSEPITTSLSIPLTASLTTSLPTTLTTTSITSETIPSVSEEKVTTNTTETVNSVPELGFGNTAVIQVQDSGNDSSLEQLMANAVLTADGNYVLMAQTEDGQVTSLPSELNLSDVISAGAAGGQTFLIETPEGLVACTAATSGEDGAIQLIPTETGDIEGTVISSAQSSGASVENQIIQAISGGQAMSYTFNSTSGCLELTAVNPTPTPTPPQKSSRGGRGSRSNKSKTTPIPSMGQTLLLTAETDTSTVTTKPLTPSSTRNKGGGGGRGRGNKITTNESNSSDSTNTSNTLQTKPNSKTLTNETLKSSTSVKGQTPESSAPQGPSQLAASRRTYSKKSNIVWITPDASQGANSTTFATVATALVKSKPQNQTTTTNSISSTTKTTVETTSLSSRVRTPSPTKVTAIITATQSTSPTKTTSVTTMRSSSPIKTVSVTAQDSSLTVIKPIDSKTTNKPMITTIANKSSPQITSSDKKDNISKTTGDTTNTTPKIITASKTVASKSSVQSSPTKGQTSDLSTQNPVTSTETVKKTTIRVSDITATKTSVETSVAKTAAKTVVTVPSATKTKTSVTKSTAPTIASTTTSTAKPTPATTPSNKTISQSITKKSSIPTITTISSVKPISTTTTTSSTKVSTNIINLSDNKSSKIPQSVTTVSNESNVSITAKQSKTSDSVKSVSHPIAVKSHVSSELSSTKSAANSSEKLNKKVSEKPVSNRNVETRHSARLSPTKSLKTDSNPKEIDSNPKVTQSSTDLKESKVESLKAFTEKEVSKNKPELENETKTKTKSRINDIETSTTQKTQKTEETLKSEIQTQLESNESTEENKSIRKSRRSSRNISIVEENKKEVKSIEENKTIETKTKDLKEIKEKNIREKIKEIPVESITTRRTSRKKEVTNEDKPEETAIDSSIVVQTTVASTATPFIEPKSQRQTRASSGKKPDVKQTPIEENLSKTVDTKLKEKETEIKFESKTESDFDRIIKETKPPEKSPEKIEPVFTKPNETTTPTRSVKKRVQFEIKEKGDEEENDYKEKVSKNLESTEKTPEMSASVSTRRSLRSSTPQTPVNPIKNDVQTNPEEVLENNTEKSEKQNIETNNKTPQRFSTRKRKEVTKSLEMEIKEMVKSPKKPKNDIESDVSYKKTVESLESPSYVRLRDRKSKGFKPKSIMKETVVRHSIETSDPFSRINRKQSLIQSFIDENEWQEKEDNLRRKTISSLSDLRSPNECYDYSTNECSFYIRHQSASLTPKQSTGNYLCQKCGFHTTRINNLVIHHRDQCSYVKNAVIQHWQTELQKRVRPSDTSLTASTSTPETKRRKTEINDELNNNLDKNTDLSDNESEDEEIAKNNGKTNQNPTISDIDAMLMGSDDEDLLSFDNIEKPKREFGFSEDDIVWVETNSTHWPALVSKVFPKEKKALIRLIDSPWPKKSLKADISSISLFDSAEVNKQYLREGRKGVNGDILVKAVQKAEDFLRKKCLGNELSALKFFDQIDSDLSEANADEDERLRPNTKDNVTTDLAKETAKTSNDSTQDSSLVNDGSNGDDTEDDKMPESNEAIAKWKEKRRQQNAKLLQCIKDGKVETHLVGVYRESITSERHQKFKSGSDAEKNQLKHVPWFGPIDDEEQQEEIYDYCSQLFKSNFKTDGSFDTVAYIFEVWVPEAIVKAISRVRRIELKESESIFAKGVILSQTEKDEMNKEIQKEAEKHMTSQTSSD